MLVFMDESGDPGFEVSKGSTPIFATAMVVFADGDAARQTEAVIKSAMERLRVRPEFKFNKCSNQVRDGFFQAVQNCPFLVRAIVVRKEAIYSPWLKTNKEDFYRFFVRQIMTHDDGILREAKVVVDGSGDRAFRRMIQASIRRQVGTRMKDLRFTNSKNDLLIQLADMCVGAIARSYRTDRPEAERWRRMLAPRINDVWDFR